MRWAKVVSGVLALLSVGLTLAWMASPDILPTRTASRAVGGEIAPPDAPAVLTAAEMKVYVSEPVTPVLTLAVRDLPEYEPGPPVLDREMARRDDFGVIGLGVQGPPWHDPLVDLQNSVRSPAPNAFTTPLTNWAGMDYNVFPPDTTGDVGPNHIVQAVNGTSGSVIRIYDKNGNILRTVALESLAPGAPCNNGYCDPTVIYDSLADRWFVNEFSASSSYPFCLYVSQTSDPTGAWYLYSWDLPYYDYPKYGLWSDAYYMGYNGGPTGYRQVFAFDRARMLAGQSATYQMFQVPALPGFGFQLVMPASLEGPTPPPAGAPGIFIRPRDTEVHGPSGYPTVDFMEMWEFHVDWNNPSNSTLTKLADVPMAEYDCTLCGTGNIWDCMPQPNTTQKLDPIREPIHYQLQYRNWGSYETLVGGFVEDVDGTDHAAVRWFEMRKVGGVWSMYQQGTVGGDAQHRSVTSVAMDGAGGIALGYTRTGPNAPYYPSILYAGRRSWDPLNTMTWVDALAQSGDSSQTANERWGDYSGIGVDPADDCTFWYTTEYMAGGSSATRIISFRFDPDFNVDASPNTLSVCAPNDAVFTVDLAKTCALNGTVTMSTSGRPSGTTESWSVNPVSPPGSTTLTIGNTGGATPGTYNVSIIGTNAGVGTRQETVSLNIATAAPGAVTLSAPADGATGVSLTPNLTWNALSGAASYDIQVATDPAFASVVRSATGLAGTSYTPSPALDEGTVYYWRVRGNNACGSGAYSSPWAFRTLESGCRTYVSADVPKAIPDKGTVDSTLNITDVYNATDVDVILGQITHPNDADLDIYIRHPDTTQVELSTDNGGTGDNYIDTVLDDEAATPITSGSAPFTGRFRPEGSLATLDGKAVNGTWTLRVSDDTKNNVGTLVSWSLYICGAPELSADYSDLAASYGVAWHTGSGTLRLGSLWDADATFAAGDDDASDDGVSFPNGWRPGQVNVVRVNVQGTPANGRWLRLWFDWNADGVFDDSELVYNNTVNGGDNDLNISVPALLQPVNYRARLYDSAGAPAAQDPRSYGGASGGEVEDGTSPAPTAVKLTSFSARPAVSGILLSWETADEHDNLGFNLYRSLSLQERGEKVNAGLIPSRSPGGGEGASYEFLDATARPGRVYFYTLEDVDLNGKRTSHGPVAGALWRAYLPLVGR